MDKDTREAKRFGVILSIVLTVIAVVIPIWKKSQIHLWAVYLAGIIFVVSISFTKIFIPVFKLWLKVTQLIAKIITVVILSVFFYLIIMPVGLVMKCCGRDPLNRSWDKNKESYWIEREPRLNDSRRLERQY